MSTQGVKLQLMFLGIFPFFLYPF